MGGQVVTTIIPSLPAVYGGYDEKIYGEFPD